MIMIEIQYRGDPGEFKGFRVTPLFASDRPLTSLDNLLKMLLKFRTKISASSHNKIL